MCFYALITIREILYFFSVNQINEELSLKITICTK